MFLMTRPGGGVSGVEAPGSVRRDPAVQTSVCIEADLSHYPMCKVLRAVEVLFIGYNNV